MINIRTLLILAFFVGLFSCSKEKISSEIGYPEDMEVEHHYVLDNIHYFKGMGDGIDTNIIKLPDIILSNPGNIQSSQSVKINYSQLVVKSQFKVDDLQQFPIGFIPDSLQANVPANWYQGDFYNLSTETFPLSSITQEIPYHSFVEDNFSIKVPSRSKIIVETKIEGYTITCSFRAVVIDKTTGMRAALTGKWIGTAGYNNGYTTISESPL